MSKALNPDELDIAISKVQWQLDKLKTISATKVLFEIPARVPPLSVIEQLNPLDMARMNEQQILYSYNVTLSTSVGLKRSISTIDSVIAVNQSSIAGIEYEQKKADVVEQGLIAEQTASYKRMILYQQSSVTAAQKLSQLNTVSTQLSLSNAKNQQFLTSTVKAVQLYDTFLSQQEGKKYVSNYEYTVASTAFSTAQKQYLATASNLSSVTARIPALEAAVLQKTVAYTTALTAKVVAQSTYQSTLSSIDGYTTLSTMSSYAADTFIKKKEQAEARRDQEDLYYQLATFYQSSNDLRIQKEEYERNLAAAAGYVQKGGGSKDSVGRVAYKMARDVYKQIGGQLTTVVDDYNSTVTGIAAFEAGMFGNVKKASDDQIAALTAEVAVCKKRKEDAAAASVAYAQQIETLSSSQRLYQASSIAIAAMYSNAQVAFQTASESIPSLETTFAIAKEESDTAAVVLKNYTTQVADIQKEIAGYQNTSTIAGREVEVLTQRIPSLQADYDDAMDRYTEVESGTAEKQAALEEATRNLTIETRYKQHADTIVNQSIKLSTLNDVFRKVAEERVKETDLRSARTALSELLAERRDQLQKISNSIAGSTGPDLTDDTYVALMERMNGLNKILDEDYDAFYGIFTEYDNRFSIYEETVTNLEAAREALLEIQGRLDNGETDATMAMAAATAEKQVEKNAAEEQMARQGLEHIAEQLDAYIIAFEKNRDAFVPPETQASTEAAIRAAASGPS